MKCRIGDISKLFGMTPQGIRYYEERGVLKTLRPTESKYRYYGDRQTSCIACSKIYRQYGFSLQDTIKLINHSSLTEIQESICRRQNEVIDLISWQNSMLKTMERQINGMKDIFDMGKNCTIKQSPYLYWANVQSMGKEHIVDEDFDVIRPWIDAIPITASSFCISTDNFVMHNESLDVKIGMCLHKEDEDSVNIDVSDEYIIRFLKQKCVYAIIESKDGEQLKLENIQHVTDFINKKHLTVVDSAFSEIIAIEYNGHDYLRYDQLYVPID